MKSAGKSHVGKIRSLNEDAFYISDSVVGPLSNLFIVADGMGGHNAGEVASAMSIQALIAYIEKNNQKRDGKSIDELISDGFIFANQSVFNKAHENLNFHGMGTTLNAVCIDSNQEMIYMANIGDSRIYVLDQSLKQVSIDHSFVEELVRAGRITREESLTHPDRNIITRAVGTSEEVAVDIFKMPIEKISKILMCSDGLSNMVSDQEMENIMKENSSPEDIVELLIGVALNNGGIDNITCVVIDLEKETGKEVPTC